MHSKNLFDDYSFLFLYRERTSWALIKIVRNRIAVNKNVQASTRYVIQTIFTLLAISLRNNNVTNFTLKRFSLTLNILRELFPNSFVLQSKLN